jgi:hypothetical protein
MASYRDFVVRWLLEKTSFETDAKSVGDSLDAVKLEADAAERAIDNLDDSNLSGLRSEIDRTEAELRNGRIQDAGREVGSEFAENIGEGLRSGDYAGVALETATSLTAALGPVGLGIGLGAAIVNGIISGMEEEQRLFKEQVAEIREALNDELTGAVLSSTIQARIAELTGGDFSKFRRDLEQVGIDVADFNEAVNEGDLAALDQIIGKLGQVAAERDRVSGGGRVKTSRLIPTEDAEAAQALLDIVSQLPGQFYEANRQAQDLALTVGNIPRLFGTGDPDVLGPGIAGGGYGGSVIP